jgi:transposase-like protein
MSSRADTLSARLAAVYLSERITVAALARRFELTWIQARTLLDQAGVEVTQSGRYVGGARPSRQVRAQIAAAYKAGEGLDSISSRFGFSVKLIRKVLDEQGVPLRGRGRPKQHRPSSSAIARLVKRYGNGASLRELAEDSDLTVPIVSELLEGAGVTLRPRGGSQPNMSFNETTLAELAAAYRDGAGFAELKARYHCGSERLADALQGQGIELRKRGRPAKTA